ncbi:MAG TPA: CAP domain-containing protein [Blastocatellia bacterium]|nr:CAP domain-containing protein [Blastocatellia bacterium]
MPRRLALSFLAMVLALVATAAAQQGRGFSAAPADERSVYTDDDVRRPQPRDSQLGEIEAMEMQCFNEVNRLRVAHGLNPLAFNEDLQRVARDYSRRMAEEKFFSHNDPNGNTVRERVTDAHIRWRVLGENLAYSNGYMNPVAVSLTGWLDSPGHRRNLLDQMWRQTAIGVWISANGTVYFTEIFMV